MKTIKDLANKIMWHNARAENISIEIYNAMDGLRGQIANILGCNKCMITTNSSENLVLTVNFFDKLVSRHALFGFNVRDKVFVILQHPHKEIISPQFYDFMLDFLNNGETK